MRYCHRKKLNIKSFSLGTTPKKYFSGQNSVKIQELKEAFLYHNIAPDFSQIETTRFKEKAMHGKENKGKVSFKLIALARKILEEVYSEYGSGERYLQCTYGDPIDKARATRYLRRYFEYDPILNQIEVIWSEDISASAVTLHSGPAGKPEERKYTAIFRDDENMHYMRELGIYCLADHEISTHFMRSYNDGLQTWATSRKHFAFRSKKSLSLLNSEEGLATVNSLFQAKLKYLFRASLNYYCACMATVMNFRELFEHIGSLEPDFDRRFRLVYRVKRSIHGDCNGGWGKDQCYLTGAVEILQNWRKIDFRLLYSGKICWDELDIAKRIARHVGLIYPKFIKNAKVYLKFLAHAQWVNGIDEDAVYSALECPSIRQPQLRPDHSQNKVSKKGDVKHCNEPLPLSFLPVNSELVSCIWKQYVESSNSVDVVFNKA